MRRSTAAGDIGVATISGMSNSASASSLAAALPGAGRSIRPLRTLRAEAVPGAGDSICSIIMGGISVADDKG